MSDQPDQPDQLDQSDQSGQPARPAPAERKRSESLTGTVALEFPEFRDPPAEPMGLLNSWLAAAAEHGVREPRALALATADARGRSSSRILVINRITEAGIVFATHADSQKGRELVENPWASGVLYWRETSQQVVLAGPVRQLPDATAEELWAARAVFTHPMTTVSRQSRPVEDLDHFEELRAKALELGRPGQPLPRPASYVAFELVPDALEFWADGTDRLHERLRYDRTADGWGVARLQP
ncbi:phenazine biosynthesis FMN-dependent oxidase PhzG [Kitasatospora purpeofusca]|uniref:phenazine biosynthesis FMN-dependent oxidase PhzG n=1 Tax=Kitasatospora purpeofusca TaxID=67352 RepID=UPI003869C4F2|nr:phenazine biosynthesis FMN-dependent oxidase PhzG [Kitasatospora purpeofusca]